MNSEAYVDAILNRCNEEKPGFKLGFVSTCVALLIAKVGGKTTPRELDALRDLILNYFSDDLPQPDLELAFELDRKLDSSLAADEIANLAVELILALLKLIVDTIEDEEEGYDFISFTLGLQHEFALVNGIVQPAEKKIFAEIMRERLDLDSEMIDNIVQTAATNHEAWTKRN